MTPSCVRIYRDHERSYTSLKTQTHLDVRLLCAEPQEQDV